MSGSGFAIRTPKTRQKWQNSRDCAGWPAEEIALSGSCWCSAISPTSKCDWWPLPRNQRGGAEPVAYACGRRPRRPAAAAACPRATTRRACPGSPRRGGRPSLTETTSRSAICALRRPFEPAARALRVLAPSTGPGCCSSRRADLGQPARAALAQPAGRTTAAVARAPSPMKRLQSAPGCSSSTLGLDHESSLVRAAQLTPEPGRRAPVTRQRKGIRFGDPNRWLVLHAGAPAPLGQLAR